MTTPAPKIIAAMLSFSVFGLSLFSQTIATWKGGKPGRTSDWACADNWKEGKVPNEFSLVVIPSDRLYYPRINNRDAVIDALFLENNTALEIREGASLTILGDTGRVDGVMLFGNILNNGILDLQHFDQPQPLLREKIRGTGALITAGAAPTAKR